MAKPTYNYAEAELKIRKALADMVCQVGREYHGRVDEEGDNSATTALAINMLDLAVLIMASNMRSNKYGKEEITTTVMGTAVNTTAQALERLLGIAIETQMSDTTSVDPTIMADIMASITGEAKH